MKKLRKILDWIQIFWFPAGGIAFAIYIQDWIISSLLILGIVTFYGFMYLLAMAGWENCFIMPFSLDYLRHLTTEVDFFKEKGFQIINHLDLGSEHPGVLMQKENSPDVRIILNAPINSSNYTVDVRVMKDPEISINYLVRTNPETKIEKLNELYGKV